MNEANFFDDMRYSKIPSLDPDPKEFPLFYKAKKYEFRLNPGERLFIPSGWFHLIDSSELDPEENMNIAVNYWHTSEHRNGIPKVKWHTITKEQVFKELNKNPVSCLKSVNGIFVSPTLNHHFPGEDLSLFEMSFDKFLENNNSLIYLAQSSIKPEFTIEEKLCRPDTKVWLNRYPAITQMHYDGSDNWFCQIIGRKRVMLFPPEERVNLYTYNPYPIQLVENIRNRLTFSETFSTYNDQISRNLIKEIMELKQDIVIHNSELLDIYKKIYMLYENHLIKKRCSVKCKVVVPDVNFKILFINCASQPISLPEDMDHTFVFSITQCNFRLGRFNMQLRPGCVHCSPNTMEYPLVLNRGVYILPTKENVTVIPDGPRV